LSVILVVKHHENRMKIGREMAEIQTTFTRSN